MVTRPRSGVFPAAQSANANSKRSAQAARWTKHTQKQRDRKAPRNEGVLLPSRSYFGNTTGSHSLSHPSTVRLVRSSLRS